MAQAKYMELLGDFPDPVPLEAEVESSVEDGDVIREFLDGTRIDKWDYENNSTIRITKTA